jgi:AraC-like DNA-binding protein
MGQAMLQELPVHPPSALVRQWLSASARQMAFGKGFASGGLEMAHRHLASTTDGRCVLSVEDSSRFGAFGAGEVRLGETSIRLLTCESRTNCRKSTQRTPDRNHIILQCVLNGSFDVIQGERRVQVRAGQALVTGTVGDTIKRWRGTSALLNIVMPHAAVARAVAADESLAGVSPVAFGRMTVIELGIVANLAHFVGAVVSDMSENRSVFFDDRIATQTERALQLLLLKSLAAVHYGHAPETVGATVSAPAPFYVRRAEIFMRENLAEALSLADLTEAAGVSSRTLQYGFRLYRQTTPMEALRKIRLTAARRALVSLPASGGSVGEIALRCGYVSLSHFSRDYRACFGESPSETVRVQ